MDADIDRKPVAALTMPAILAGAGRPMPENTPKAFAPVDDPLFAALERMRIRDEVDNRMRNEEIDEELQKLSSYVD